MRTLSAGRSQVNMIETRKREHSRKPDEQYDVIESCSPGPYLELFARYPRSGWTVWGNEADEDITPQGKCYKGYGGGEIPSSVPDLPFEDVQLPLAFPNQRFPEATNAAMAEVIANEYLTGLSIRDLATKHAYSIARVRSLLQKANVSLRERGREATT